jgi:histidinol-phosphate aminotransferase
VEFATDRVEDMLAEYKNLVISHTFSKAMGLAGIRLGWVIANPEIIGYINGIRTSLNISLVAHVAAIAAIDDRQYIEENVRRVIADRELFYNEIQKLPGFRPIPSEANFVMVDCEKSGFKASDIYNYLLGKGYLARCFVRTRGMSGDRFFRVTIGTHEDTVNVLSLIREYVEQHT